MYKSKQFLYKKGRTASPSAASRTDKWNADNADGYDKI